MFIGTCVGCQQLCKTLSPVGLDKFAVELKKNKQAAERNKNSASKIGKYYSHKKQNRYIFQFHPTQNGCF